jgi:hypothetical protein
MAILCWAAKNSLHGTVPLKCKNVTLPPGDWVVSDLVAALDAELAAEFDAKLPL